MANVTITQLPQAGAITGQELVPVVQNGQTVQTTTGAIAASPAQTQTFITVNQEPTLPNSRALAGSTGVGLTDNGAQGSIEILLNGVSGSLESSGVGLITKTGGTVTGRTLVAGGNGLSVTNGNGVAGNPSVALTGALAALAGLSGTGILVLDNTNSVGTLEIVGTANQIGVANGTGPGNPTVSIVDDVILPGTGAVTLPGGTTAERPAGAAGELRYNSDTTFLEYYTGLSWANLAAGTAIANNIAGGAANQILYQVGTSSTGFITAPSVANTFLEWTGSAFQWSVNPLGTVTSVDVSGGTTGLTYSGGPITSSGTITMAGTLITSNGGTGLTTYTAGDLLYYVGGTTLAQLAIGSTNQIMTSSGTAPQWVAPSTVNVGTATNVAGGTSGALPYQTGAGTTSFLSLGTYQRILTAGVSAPEWTLPANVSVGNAEKVTITPSSGNTNFYLAFAFGAGSNYVQIDGGGNATYNPSTNVLTVPTFAGTLSGNATSATNVAGGAANQIVYNTGAGATSFITAPSVANTYLEWSGSAFQWSANPLGTVTSVDVSGGTTGLTTSGGPITSSGTITIAGTLITSNGGTGLDSYTAGDLLYYSTGTALSKLAIGSSTFLLTSDGSAPGWTDPNNIVVGVASQVETTLTSTNATYYPTFVATTSDANPIEVDTDLTYNPSTNTLTVPTLVATSGISGGTF